MEVIMLKDLPELGFVGEKVVVKPGYARNFLIPQGFSVEINKRNERFLKNKMKAIQAMKVKLKSSAEEVLEKVQGMSFSFQLKVGESGKSFGSLTSKDIYEDLKSKGFILERAQISLPEPVKFAGEHSFKLRLHSEIDAEIPFTVIADEIQSDMPEKKAKSAQADDEADELNEDGEQSEASEA